MSSERSYVLHQPNRRLDGSIVHSVIKRLRNVMSNLGYLNDTAPMAYATLSSP